MCLFVFDLVCLFLFVCCIAVLSVLFLLPFPPLVHDSYLWLPWRRGADSIWSPDCFFVCLYICLFVWYVVCIFVCRVFSLVPYSFICLTGEEVLTAFVARLEWLFVWLFMCLFVFLVG